MIKLMMEIILYTHKHTHFELKVLEKVWFKDIYARISEPNANRVEDSIQRHQNANVV